jgi:hypothetical protein
VDNRWHARDAAAGYQPGAPAEDNAFAAARTALDEQVARWAPLGAFVVADTSVYIEHEKKLKELDLAALIDAEGDLAPVHLLVPIVVLDELDGLKNKGPTQHVKWRAGYTLAVFDQVFCKGTGARAQARETPPRSGTYLCADGGDRLRPARPRAFAGQRRRAC